MDSSMNNIHPQLPSSTHSRSRRRTAAEMSETPMIIDISLDRSGNQVYQLTNLNSIKRDPYENNSNNNNNKRSADDVDDANDVSSPSSSTSSTRSKRARASLIRKIKEENLEQEESSSSGGGGGDSAAEDVWCPAVETSFQEALEIIPKQGLHKIKVCGRACGRNELISDYIEHCTGKYRTRKQVSSHIQVVKNLGRDRRLIDLILVGPPQTEETISRFNETFFGILMKKQSGGVIDPENPLPKQLLELPAVMSPTATSKRTSSSTSKRHPSRSKLALSMEELWNIKVTLVDYYMKQTLGGLQSTVSRLSEGEYYLSPLRIRSNADLSRRFPTLISLVSLIKEKAAPASGLEFSSSVPPVPVLHCMVKMVTPPLLHPALPSIEYEVKGRLKLTDLPKSDESCYCCLTLCYTSGELVSSSYEKIISKLDRSDSSLDLELTVGGSKFWQNYYNDVRERMKLRRSDDPSGYFTLKNITMQQVVFNVVPKEYKAAIPDKYSLEDIPQSSIRGIVLWEHLRVKDINQAVTTVRNIHMPAPARNIVPGPVPELPKEDPIIKREFESTSPPSEHDLNNYLASSSSAMDLTNVAVPASESPQSSFNAQPSLLSTPHTANPTLSSIPPSSFLDGASCAAAASLQQESYYDDYQIISGPSGGDINGLFPTPVSNGCTPVFSNHGGPHGGNGHAVRFLSALPDEDDGDFANVGGTGESTLSSVLDLEGHSLGGNGGEKMNAFFDADVNGVKDFWFST